MKTFQHGFQFNNGVELKNRVLLAPLTNTQSHEDGTLGDDELRWLEAHAKGGFGGVITAASHVQETAKGYPGQLGSFSDIHIPGLRRIAEMAKQNAALAILQLIHGGRRSPSALTGVQPTSASAVESSYPGSETPRALTEPEIEQIIAAFAAAAGRAHAAGMTGIELHGANGYLFTQFHSTETNHRGDQWGGSNFNRTRLLRETVAAIRKVVPASFLVGVRVLAEHSAAERGFDIDESAELIGWLSELGTSYIHIAQPSFRARSWKYPESEETNLHRLAKVVRNGVAVVAAGGIRVGQDAEDALGAGADLVAVGKAAITTPDWPVKALDDGFSPSQFPLTEAELKAAGITRELIRYLRMINLVKEA
uniref:NADH:flavin oxidoreductase/NADH oxidase n=1 Tax=Chondromyces catenulatus TaxID=1653841 RepID=A0A3S5GY21_9BACT|nr:NADH:flavin oxidoreductase/NADH oxidase [Chondromyces catenulatus]